jgi:hypothetical protein
MVKCQNFPEIVSTLRLDELLHYYLFNNATSYKPTPYWQKLLL